MLIERVVLDAEERPATMAGIRRGVACFGSPIMIGYPLPAIGDRAGHDVWLGADGGCERAVVRGVSHAAVSLQAVLRALLEKTDALGQQQARASG